MGKTGTTRWVKIKNNRGKYRLVAEKRTGFKKPGPNQRYDGKGRLRRRIKRSPSSLIK
ncbi:DUF5350 family protein [Candidatus Methanoliparum sp. LAM-1]|uniref:DUF5350 family protein n=1 Tax=Candidatus Methanoliparum sp. LAM-1 TaxID=2874846 RepID=UPI001E377DB8|nr:DUF5350 family protein [Candidatus Methanoliparum sp. LAM-1]BDC36185.1 hypothetical protein MTLP_08670 [Candidatus Methanoliparum sp. LAM-1]